MLLQGTNSYIYKLHNFVLFSSRLLVKSLSRHSSFFQNEEISVQLDELDELDRIIHAWIGFN